MMKISISLFLILLSFILNIECERSKKDILIQKISENPIIRMTPNEYERFVATGPRTYTTMVLAYPIGNQQYEVLTGLDLSLSTIALSYNKWFERSASSTQERPVIFVVFDLTRDQSLLKKHGINMVAALYVIPPTTSSGKPTYNQITGGQMFDLRNEWSVANVHGWVQKQLKVQFPIYVDPLQLVLRYTLYAVTLLLSLLIIRFVYRNFVGPTHRMFWFFICSIVWIIVAGGTHFCILRGVPWTIQNPRTGDVQYFHPSQGSQLLAEGYIMTTSQFGTSMVLVTLCTVYPQMKNGLPKRLFGYFLISLLLSGLYWVKLRHTMKLGWD
eukprot:c20712_g2_i1.p1 GENE.c20712_g2_i1~~c20712_g2_i1.p1  ORF type:complete len:328 (+),score=106.50 c20712_g2_i1:28-1011(+)